MIATKDLVAISNGSVALRVQLSLLMFLLLWGWMRRGPMAPSEFRGVMRRHQMIGLSL